MSTPNLDSALYRSSNDALQGAFRYGSHQNIPVQAVSNTSAAVDSGILLLSATDYYRFEVNGVATSASAILPPGITAMIIDKGDTISTLRVSGADSELTIIIPV